MELPGYLAQLGINSGLIWVVVSPPDSLPATPSVYMCYNAMSSTSFFDVLGNGLLECADALTRWGTRNAGLAEVNEFFRPMIKL